MAATQSSSPLQYPSTPIAFRYPLQFKPLNSSPLADSSPLVAAQARRKSQYKGHTPTTPRTTRSVSGTRSTGTRLFSGGNSSANCGTVERDPQKFSLRDRFKARCLERAVKAREKAIRGRRHGGLQEPSSDDYPMDDDDSEDEEDIMQDELFRRIMANASRKEKHAYRLSYAYEVGSSFDPDLEDISSWEQELSASNSADPHGSSLGNFPSTSTLAGSSVTMPSHEQEEDLTPVDLDDEELEAYAEECAQQAAFADFEDIPEEELFNWSDDELRSLTTNSASHITEDAAMDVS